MPDQYGYPTEAELRGQQSSAPLLGYAPPTRAELDARDAAARAGRGTVTLSNGQTLTGDQFRTSTDPLVTALRAQMLSGGRSDPNLLFGEARSGMGAAEREYRERYHNFMRNPNSGVDHNEALRSLGLFALAPAAAYGAAALGAGAAPAGAAGAEAAAAGAGGVGGAAGAGAGAAASAGSAAGLGAAGAAIPEIVVTGTLGGGITAGEALLGGAGLAGTAALNAPTAAAPGGFNGYGEMGGFQPMDTSGGLMDTLPSVESMGAGNMGALVASQSGVGLLGGPLGDVAQSVASNYLQGLLGGGQGGGAGGAPMPQLGGFLGSPAPAAAPAARRAPLNQTTTRFQGYGRRPLNFRGATVWL